MNFLKHKGGKFLSSVRTQLVIAILEIDDMALVDLYVNVIPREKYNVDFFTIGSLDLKILDFWTAFKELKKFILDKNKLSHWLVDSISFENNLKSKIKDRKN